MAGTQDIYYMIVFGSQRHPNWPRFSHSFGVVVAAQKGGASGQPSIVNTQCISWLPETMEIHWTDPIPETGKNFTLDVTLDWVYRPFDRVPSKVSAWGPFAIKKKLYTAFSGRVVELESGTVQYIAVDNLKLRPHRATNCIHALSDLGLTPDLLRTFALHGRLASLRIVNYFNSLDLLIDPATTYDWIKTDLKLDHRDITYEDV